MLKSTILLHCVELSQTWAISLTIVKMLKSSGLNLFNYRHVVAKVFFTYSKLTMINCNVQTESEFILCDVIKKAF